MSKEFVEATAFLLQHGLGDPRGGTFVEATVAAPFAQRESRSVPKLGWLLPNTPDGAQRFVGVDGLEYRPLSVSGPIDPEGIIEKAPAQLNVPAFLSWDFDSRALPAALFLLHGDPRLAERLLDDRHDRKPYEAFLNLANGYLASRFHRAVGAHVRGEDALALEDATALQRDRTAYEAEGKRLLGEEWTRQEKSQRESGLAEAWVFGYLSPVASLRQDSERRVAEGPRPALSLQDLRLKSAEERIRTLIAHLDQTDATGFHTIGDPLTFGDDPVVAALIDEGDAAVDALLDVMEFDQRLTRAVDDDRRFTPYRTLTPVKDVAYQAFRVIAWGDLSMPWSPAPPVAEMRDYWRKSRGLSPAERWLAILADGTAGGTRWSEAADRIVEGTNVTRFGGFAFRVLPEPAGGAPMKGETLRGRSDPTVTEVMVRRAGQLVPSETADGSAGSRMYESLQIAWDLFHWDPAGSLPTLQKVTRRIMRTGYPATSIEMPFRSGRELGNMIEARTQLGDTEALLEYAEFLPRVDLASLAEDSGRIFKPIVRHPESALMRNTARKIFIGNGAQPSLQTLIRRRSGWSAIAEIVRSPVLALPEVQKALEPMFLDRAALGEAWVEGLTLHIETNGSIGSGGANLESTPEGRAPVSGVRRSFRVCDAVAWEISKLKGAPKFQPAWTEAERDCAVLRVRSFLRQNSERVSKLLVGYDNWTLPRTSGVWDPL